MRWSWLEHFIDLQIVQLNIDRKKANSFSKRILFVLSNSIHTSICFVSKPLRYCFITLLAVIFFNAQLEAYTEWNPKKAILEETNPSLQIDSCSELDFLRSIRFQVESDHTLAPKAFSIFLLEEFATDTDQDGVIDINDIDDDNDGILDTIEGCTDTVVAGANGSSIT